MQCQTVEILGLLKFCREFDYLPYSCDEISIVPVSDTAVALVRHFLSDPRSPGYSSAVVRPLS